MLQLSEWVSHIKSNPRFWNHRWMIASQNDKIGILHAVDNINA
jgi:hypothetical protein